MSDEETTPEPAPAKAQRTKSAGGYVGTRTRRVQYGSDTLDIEEGEPVDVPDGLGDSWVEMGWVTAPEE